MDEIAFQTSGFNHQAFVTRFERDGEDLYPHLDAAIEADPEGLGRRVRVQLYKELGYFPTESSEHSAEYVSWFMRHDDQIERFRIPVDDYIGRTEEALEDYREIVRKLEGGETVEVPAGERARVRHHPLDRDRDAACDLREREEHRPDPRPAPTAAASRCRAWWTGPACNRRRYLRARRT